MLTRYIFYLLSMSLLAQNPNTAAPDPKAPAFRAAIEKTSKLALESIDLKAVMPQGDWPTTMVSWVATDRSGLIYLLQRSDKADPVVVIDRNGRLVRSWGKGMYTMPHAIRIDAQGNVWTTDAATSKLTKFSPDGEMLQEIAVGGQPNPCVPRLTLPPGSTGSNFCGTTDLAFASNGHIFVSDGYANARILEYTPDGKKLREWGTAGDGPGQFFLPHSIQIDDKGTIYVADRENARIQRFTLEGKYLGEWSTYGKTYGMRLKGDSLWIATQMRLEANGNTGWLIKLNRQTGQPMSYTPVKGGVHGVEVLDSGETIVASPGQNQMPQFFRLARFY
jgi:hypothetical protein